MNATDLLTTLESLGVRLSEHGGRLRVSAAPGQLTDELKAQIGTQKPQLLRLLAQRTAAPASPEPPEEQFPVSAGQRRLWFLHELEPELTAYNLGASHMIEGPLDVELLERALDDVAQRQAALRTVFRSVDGEPVQVVLAARPTRLALIDLSHLSPDVQAREAERHKHDEAARPFDLAQGPLWRAALLRLAPQRHVLLFTLHHIVCDGWSLGVFLADLRHAYDARRDARAPAWKPLALSFGQYARHQGKHLDSTTLQGQVEYWRRRLAGAPTTLELPTDRPRPPRLTYNGAVVSFDLPAALSNDLRALARRERATPYMTLLAVFKALLSRYSGQTDIVVGTPVANRPTADLEALIGLFVTTLPLRSELGADHSGRALIGQIRDEVIEAQAHGDLPFERMVSELSPERSMAWSPIFQVVFALQNTPLASSFAVTTVGAMYDLSLFMWDEPGGMHGSFEYNTDLFDAATVRRMSGHFEALASSLVAAPDCAISRLPLLTAAERAQLLRGWNDTARPYPRESSLHDQFDAAARRWPDAVALAAADPDREVLPVARLTYGELLTASDRLAALLCDSGVQPGAAVGLYVERSLGAVVAMLAILKAGAAYVPLDIGDPPARTADILQDAGVHIVVTQRSLAERVASRTVRALVLEDAWQAGGGTARERASVGPDALAYVMFTSGTTGRPKGVCVSHRNVLRLVCNPDYIELGPEQVLLQFAPLAFDASTLEIWGALLNGSRLVVHPQSVPTAAQLAQVLGSHGITALWLTAGFFHYMVENEVQALAEVQQVLAGGDVLSVPHVQRLLDAKRTGAVVNGYGPTENTTFTCCHRMTPGVRLGESVPIGRPIANTRVYVLDAQGEPVPPGVAGELFAGGDGVALGYLANPAATAEKFLPDPFDERPGATMYRTGDLARWRADGTIQFLGRRDRQVKVRGFRIELEEVEDALRACAPVGDAAVVVRRDTSGASDLVAYLVPRDDASIDVAAVRLALAERLPAYMVPSAFMRLAELPLTPNGKLDRAALPAPAALPGDGRTVDPETLLETQLHSMWSVLLGRTDFGVTDNFFDLGGHSLLAVRLFAQIERAFGMRLPVSALFLAPDVRRLAQRLEHEGFASPWSSLVAVQPTGTRRPLFLVPGIGGNVVCFLDLARHLGPDQPLYALQAHGLDPRAEPFDRIEPMAAHYVAEMRKAQPEGPYRIGGTCFGGVVAYEMAQQLRAAGKAVEMLFLLETWPPEKARPLVDAWRTRAHAARFLASAVKRNLDKMRTLPWQELGPAIRSRLRIVGEIASQRDIYRGDRAAMYVDRVSLANRYALMRYSARPFDGPVRLAIASQRRFDGDDRRRIWRSLAPHDYAQFDIPSRDSGTMLIHPHVEALAAWMSEMLDALDRQAAPSVEPAVAAPAQCTA